MNESASALNDPFTSSLAGRRLGRYEVLARLASGGMAGVYVARAQGVAGFERLFAIKVLHPHLAHEQEFISMFLDEARLAARIRHPNVVPTIDISDTEDAGFYLVMDYIEGDHLGALLQQAFRRGTKLPTAVSLRIVVDALNGLGAAHNLTDENGQRINLVHRDISPHNVMVSTDGIARITDFGVAKAEVRLSTTQDGQFKGKLAYMSPEHASNGEADQRSDLFAMAIILWECLTGRRLFRAENHAATLHKICLEDIPLPSSVDPALAPFDDVLAKGLQRDPDARFQSAEEFAEAIEEHAHALAGIANPRLVGKLVREYAGEKLDRDADLIRSAVAEINAGVPRPPISMPSARAKKPTPAVKPPPALVVPPPAADAAPPLPATLDEPPKRKSAGAWVVVGLALVVIALAAAALTLSSRENVTSAPLPIAADAPAKEGASTEAAQAPAPAQAQGPQAAPTAGAVAAEIAEGAANAENAAPGTPQSATPSAAAAGEQAAQPAEPARPTVNEPQTPKPEPSRTSGRGKRKASGASKPAQSPAAAAEEDLLLNPYRAK